MSLTPLTLLQIVLMGLIESYRANGGIDDDLGLDRLYPGGDYFDPLGLADDPDSFAELRVNTMSRHIACAISLFQDVCAAVCARLELKGTVARIMETISPGHSYAAQPKLPIRSCCYFSAGEGDQERQIGYVCHAWVLCASYCDWQGPSRELARPPGRPWHCQWP